MREHINADEQFVREDVTVEEALERFRGRGPGLQGRADRGPRRQRRPRRAARRPSASTRTARSPTSAAARTRRARSASRPSSCSPSPAPTGAATPTASSSRASTAPRSSPRRSSTSTSSASSRPARATTASSARSSGCSCSASCRPARRSGSRPGWRSGTSCPSSGARRTARRGYREVKTPILYDVDLFKQSGHWDKYRENMYFTDVEDRPMGLKPMNCPAHIQLFKDERRSYRDLPVRYSEQGLVHRHEPSGTLHGLMRVRHITQDDAHIFCTRGADPRGGHRLPGLRLLPLRPVRLRAAPRALDAAREADRLRRDVGPRRGGAAGRARRARPRRTRSTRATARSTARRSTCT